MMMRVALMLAAAVVALALLVAPAAGYSSSTYNPAFRFAQARSRALERIQVRDFAGTDKAQTLLDHIAAVKVGKWGTDEKAVGALSVLRAIVALTAEPASEEAMWAATTVKAANNNKLVEHGSGASKAIFEWTNQLRKKFVVGTGGEARPTALVRGAGPGGLAAALFLRAKRDGGAGLANIDVYDNRDAYTRGHYVTLKKKKTLTGGGDGDYTETVTITGMTNLLHTVIGANKMAEFVWNYDPNGDEPQIPTSTLEHHLALAAHVVGVKFTYKAAEAGTGDKLKKDILKDFKFDDRGQKFTALPANGAGNLPDTCAAPSEPVEAKRNFASDEDITNHDVIIVAEGTTSHTRAYSSLFKHPSIGTEAPQFSLGKFHMAEESDSVAANKISRLIETNGGLPNFAFVLAPDTAYTPLTTATDSQLRSAPYTKLSMTEFQFKVKPGQRLLAGVSADCSYNYNIFSETKSTYAAEFPKLRLAYHVFSEGATWVGADDSKKANAALAKFHQVQEIKMWTTGFRIAHKGDDAKVFVGYLRPETTDNAGDHKIALLIGDSAREALPDDGMGANDAHDTALLAAKVVFKWKAGYNECKDGVMKAIGNLQEHTQKVAAAIQFKNADAYSSAPKLGDDGKGAQVSLVKAGGKFKLGANKLHYPNSV